MKYKYVKSDTKRKKMKPITFGDLTNGDIFVHSCLVEDCLDGNLYGALYIKLKSLKSEKSFNAVNLMDGGGCYISDNAEVKYYSGEIKIDTGDLVEKVPVEDED